MSSGLGSFSKASCVASTEDGDGQGVNLDDPDFWGKYVRLEAPHESIGEDIMKVIFEKRSHKQVKVYDPYDEFAEICPDLAILLLSDSTALNEIIRSFWIFTFIFECYFIFLFHSQIKRRKTKLP